jgi:hypothetical protein
LTVMNLAKAGLYSCEYKPTYPGGVGGESDCPNYFSCHGDEGTNSEDREPCSCESFCDYDPKCCPTMTHEEA